MLHIIALVISFLCMLAAAFTSGAALSPPKMTVDRRGITVSKSGRSTRFPWGQIAEVRIARTPPAEHRGWLMLWQTDGAPQPPNSLYLTEWRPDLHGVRLIDPLYPTHRRRRSRTPSVPTEENTGNIPRPLIEDTAVGDQSQSRITSLRQHVQVRRLIARHSFPSRFGGHLSGLSAIFQRACGALSTVPFDLSGAPFSVESPVLATDAGSDLVGVVAVGGLNQAGAGTAVDVVAGQDALSPGRVEHAAPGAARRAGEDERRSRLQRPRCLKV